MFTIPNPFVLILIESSVLNDIYFEKKKTDKKACKYLANKPCSSERALIIQQYGPCNEDIAKLVRVSDSLINHRA